MAKTFLNISLTHAKLINAMANTAFQGTVCKLRLHPSPEL